MTGWERWGYNDGGKNERGIFFEGRRLVRSLREDEIILVMILVIWLEVSYALNAAEVQAVL